MHTKNDYDWSKFTLRINIHVSKERIYQAWTTRREIEKWFVRTAEFRSPHGVLLPEWQPVTQGDLYEWKWHGYPDSVNEKGSFLHANGVDMLSFSFGIEGTVIIEILSHKEAVIVQLTQKNIPVEDHHKVKFHLGCSVAWSFYLSNLKSYLEGGIDLRNKNKSILDVINA